MSTWNVVYEQTATFAPALPGVVAAGGTREDTEQLIGEAIARHFHGLAEDGLPIPDPESVAVGGGN
ncbi:MAG: type II toxin-antitoxin system HicB family antitoxin [Acidimicrobiales bacterium]